MLSRLCFCLLLLFFFCGCCRQKDLLLSPDLRPWAPYAPQQELTFVNAAGEKLHFTAQLHHFNKDASDKLCGDYAVETLQVDLRSKEDPAFKVQVTLSHEILVGVRLLRSDTPAQGLNITFNIISQQYISDPWRDKFFLEKAVNGQHYRQVLQAFSFHVTDHFYFSEIYYAREAGLVGFKLFSGDTYFLQ